MKKLAIIGLLCSPFLFARADLTMVQKVEGPTNGEITVKIKGDKLRIESSPQHVTIVDSKTGEITRLMNNQKHFVRISPDTVRAAMEMVSKFTNKSAEKPKLVATGKKETINGYETEEYTAETSVFKATYWIARNYPDATAILSQLKVLNSGAWKPDNMDVPDYSEFPGIPLKSSITTGGAEVKTTLVAIKEDPLNDAEFLPPPDFREVKTRQIEIHPSASETASPTP